MVKRDFGSSRALCFALKSKIKKLSVQRNRDIDAWLKAWKEVQKICGNFIDEVDLEVAKAMSGIGFSFEAAHKLFNEGVCNGLGRPAMLIGSYFMKEAIRHKRKDLNFCNTVYTGVQQSLDPNGTEDFSDDDKAILKALASNTTKTKLKKRTRN